MSHFVKIPHSLIDNNTLRVGEKMTAVSLLSYADYQTGECFPSIEKIAARAGCACACVRKALKKLELEGYIKIIKSPRQTNKYNFSDILNSGKFAKVGYHVLKDQSLRMYDKIVFAAIIRCGYGVDATATLKKICKTTNCSVPTVKKSLLRLIELKYVFQVKDFYCEMEIHGDFFEKAV